MRWSEPFPFTENEFRAHERRRAFAGNPLHERGIDIGRNHVEPRRTLMSGGVDRLWLHGFQRGDVLLEAEEFLCRGEFAETTGPERYSSRASPMIRSRGL